MDLLRSCYRSKMRLFRDRLDVLVDGSWHWCGPLAKPVPFPHSFTSQQWRDDPGAWDDGLGEASGRGEWVPGTTDPRLCGLGVCGDADHWLNGGWWAERGTPPNGARGVPDCCPPNPGPVPGRGYVWDDAHGERQGTAEEIGTGVTGVGLLETLRQGERVGEVLAGTGGLTDTLRQGERVGEVFAGAIAWVDTTRQGERVGEDLLTTPAPLVDSVSQGERVGEAFGYAVAWGDTVRQGERVGELLGPVLYKLSDTTRQGERQTFDRRL